MKVFVDKDSCIRAVGTTTDTSLTELTINDETNPFEGWSKAKICCYRVTVVDGVVTMMTPYVDSKLLDTIDMIGHQIESITPYTETKTAYYGEKEKTFYDVPKGNISVTFDSYSGDYSTKRVSDRVTVFFDTLTDSTNITISVI